MSHSTQQDRLNPAQCYEAYFVPAIGLPIARDLVAAAALRKGERVLDVACGTGVVARLAAREVGDGGSVAGVDPHPGMLAVARAQASAASIDWYETGAEAMPLPDDSFDVVLCQMGLQFFSDKPAGVREMRRVLAPGGRILVNAPGPTPPPLQVMADGLTENIGPRAGAFVHVVFSLHDPDELRALLEEAGFTDVKVAAERKTLRVPPPSDFMWQYIHSTPLAPMVAEASDEQRAALERDVFRRWQSHADGDGMTLEVDITTATGLA